MTFDKNGCFIISRDEVIFVFSQALKRLVNEDIFLLKANAQERALQFKLASYLREYFIVAEHGGLNLDVEYNRDGKNNIKRGNQEHEYNKEENPWITLDIILHERGSAAYGNKNNILYCEIKKNSTSCKNDAKRIIAQIENRNYKFGINLYSLNSEKINLDLYINSHTFISYKFNSDTQKLEKY